MNKTQKEYAGLGVLVIAILVVLYFTYFKPSQPASDNSGIATNSTSTVGIDSNSTSGGTVSGASAAASAGSGSSNDASVNQAAASDVQPAANGPILPNGTTIDLSALKDPLFGSLIAPTYPVVSKDEVGQPNPFAASSVAQGK